MAPPISDMAPVRLGPRLDVVPKSARRRPWFGKSRAEQSSAPECHPATRLVAVALLCCLLTRDLVSH